MGKEDRLNGKKTVRDDHGRFVDAPGPGRPPRPVEESFAAVWSSEVTPEELRKAIRRLLEDIHHEDPKVRLAALKLLLDRCVPVDQVQVHRIESEAPDSTAFRDQGLERCPPELIERVQAEGGRVLVDLDSCSAETKRDFIRATASVQS